MAKKSEEAINLYLNTLSDRRENVHCRWAWGDTAMHRHVDFYEFDLICEGSFCNIFRNTKTTMEAGTLFLYDVGKKHDLVSNESKTLHFTMCVSAPYFQSLSQSFFPDRMIFAKSGFLQRKLDENTFRFMRDICTALMKKEEADTEKAKLFIYNALHLLLEETASKRPSHSDQIVTDILLKFHNYTYLTCSIQDIYDQYPCSAATLIKMFKERTGETIIHYQTNARLECAARFLRETNQSVEQITANLGFSSNSYFFRIFKERYGMTPSAYRINARQIPDTQIFSE